MIRINKIILATLLVLCLFDMPYGYYELVRFLAMVGFGYLALKSYQFNKDIIAVGKVDLQLKYQLTINYLLLLILFQPFFKIKLGRELWNIVDVIVGVGLFISVIKQKKIK